MTDPFESGQADSVITRAVGEELKRARQSAGLSRAGLAERLPSIHTRTLAAYEQGVRQFTVSRLVELCHIIGVGAPAVLDLALQRADIHLNRPMHVDLRAVLDDTRESLAPLRDWARKRLHGKRAGPAVVRLEPGAIREIAVLLDFDPADLAKHLADFAPEGKEGPHK